MESFVRPIGFFLVCCVFTITGSSPCAPKFDFCLKFVEDFQPPYKMIYSAGHTYARIACLNWNRMIECAEKEIKYCLNPVEKQFLKSKIVKIFDEYNPICANFKVYSDLVGCFDRQRLTTEYTNCDKIGVTSNSCSHFEEEVQCRLDVFKKCPDTEAQYGAGIVKNSQRVKMNACQCDLNYTKVRCERESNNSNEESLLEDSVTNRPVINVPHRQENLLNGVISVEEKLRMVKIDVDDELPLKRQTFIGNNDGGGSGSGSGVELKSKINEIRVVSSTKNTETSDSLTSPLLTTAIERLPVNGNGIKKPKNSEVVYNRNTSNAVFLESFVIYFTLLVILVI